MSVTGDLRQLLRGRDYRKLFTIRMASQCGDGVFEAGLAALFFFSPQNATTAGGVAVAFTVMLLPFTLVGPWAGVLLDRWRRRQVLLYGNLIRAGLVVLILAATITLGQTSPAVYVLALVCLGVNRFLLSALSAGLPLVVDRPLLLMANSVTPTMGSIGFGIGIGIGGGIRLLTGTDTWVLAAAAVVFALAAWTAQRMAPGDLGPERRPEAPIRGAIRQAWTDLASAAGYLVARETPALGLGIMGVHRFLFGVTFLSTILISRNLFSDSLNTDGLSTFAVLVLGTGIGTGLAVVVTPLAHRYLTPEQWIIVCLTTAAAAQIILAASPALAPMTIALTFLGLAAQGAKIAVDTIVQRDTADEYRGRAFAFYDVIYNAAFVGAAALAAAALPDTGYSRTVYAILAGAYLVTGYGYRLLTRVARTP